MSIIKELELTLSENYNDYFQTISEISVDDANEQVLCNHSFHCWNFDGIIQAYAKEKGIDAVSTPDLLYFDDVANTLVFVEFKNGKFDSKSKKGTRAKIVEGPYIGLKELLENHRLSFQMEELVHLKRMYIVVFNQEKNPTKQETYINPFHEKMNRVRSRSILERYEHIFVEKVHVLPPEKFIRLFVNEWEAR